MQTNPEVKKFLKGELKKLSELQTFFKRTKSTATLDRIKGLKEIVYGELHKNRNQQIMITSMKITYLHYLINPHSTSGNDGLVSRNPNLLSNVYNKDFRRWRAKLDKEITIILSANYLASYLSVDSL